MPSKSKPAAASEWVVSGNELGLPLIHRVAMVRTQSASRITWHTHEGYEILFLLEGATSYEFADGRTVALPGGHFLLVPPGVRHRGVHDVRQPALLCGLMFDTRRTSHLSHAPFTRRELQSMNRLFAASAVQAYRMKPELRRLIRLVMQTLADRDPHDELASAGFRLTVCSMILEVAGQLADPRSLGPNRAVEAAISLMNERLGETISMDEIAEAAHCSRARMFEIFKETTGMTPNDYLQRLRVERAKASLVAGDEPVTAIALANGFTSSQYFSSVFRKYMGFTPSEYRERQSALMAKERSKNDGRLSLRESDSLSQSERRQTVRNLSSRATARASS